MVWVIKNRQTLFIEIYCVTCVLPGTLTPDGTVSLDCGSQQTFTCRVTNTAAWTISLDGISLSTAPGITADTNSARINTTDSGALPSSTITITGFTEADNGGTIQCVDLVGGSVQGMANISVGESTS